MRRRRMHRMSQPWPALDVEADRKRLYEEHVRYYNSPENRLQRARELAQIRAEAERAAMQRVAILREREEAVAKRAAYERGFLAGAYSAQSVTGRPQPKVEHTPAVVDESSIRQKIVDEMLESCRVIAESNPNMDSKSFLKAVKQRSKKIL